MALKPRGIVLSPGPCTPNEAGICLELIEKAGPKIPLLGVCLGHQAIGQAYGGKVVRAPVLMHGKLSKISHTGKGLFKALPKTFEVTRYHSLIVAEHALPPGLEIAAYTQEGEIMGLRVAGTRTEGVQFHPESILTPEGPRILANFLRNGTRVGAEA